MNGSNSIWIRMDHGVLARRNSGGPSGQSPLIRAAPQKLLSLRRPWSLLLVLYGGCPLWPRTSAGLGAPGPRYCAITAGCRPPMFPQDWGFSGGSVANSGLPACGEMSGHERPRPAKLPCSEYGRDLLRRIFFACDRAAWPAYMVTRTDGTVAVVNHHLSTPWLCSSQHHRQPIIHRLQARLQEAAEQAACSRPLAALQQGRDITAGPHRAQQDGERS